MKNIPYLDILKKSWLTTWKHKQLWWFGLLLTLGGNGINFNIPQGNWDAGMGGIGQRVGEFFSHHAGVLIGAAIVVVAICATLFVLKIFAQAGVLVSLDAAEKQHDIRFKTGMNKGKAYFWKLCGMEIVVAFLVMCIIVVLAVPVIFLFYAEAMAFGILAAVLAVIICIPLVVLATFIGKYARFYIVLSEAGIRESLELGYCLFRKNIFESILMTLFFIPIGMALAIAVIVLLLIIGLVFLVEGLLLYALLAQIGIVVAIVSGAFIFVGAVLLLSSVYAAFHQAVWFSFFKEIASPREEEKSSETAQEMIKKSLPNPEGA